MKFVALVTAVVALGDVVTECGRRIKARQQGWDATCRYWCDHSASDDCQDIDDAAELISCIQKQATYCYDSFATDALTDDELVAGCEERITSAKAEWIPSCKNFCKSFLPGKGTICSEEVKDVDTLVACVHETFDYCIPEDSVCGDPVELCELQINSTREEWLPTCRRWCSQYAAGTELAATCNGSVDKMHGLIQCINQYHPYCFE